MSDPIVSIKKLNFSYNKKDPILNGLNIEVPHGSIYGFLGPNGAGKSTTLRNMLGLLKPNQGVIKIFGQNLKGNRKKLMLNIGSLIEDPSLYGHLSAFDNLKVACRYLNLSTKKIDPILDMVKLSDNAHKASKKYSTGMKKRLGLGLALLRDPDLLILDEPTTGLDPVGIKEFREILKTLQQQGKTIILSSHLLSEIEKIANQVGIIKKGELVFEGNLNELDVLLKSNIKLQIKIANASKAKQILDNQYQVALHDENHLSVAVNQESDIPAIVQKLVNHKINIYELTPQKSDLEKLFLDITLRNIMIQNFINSLFAEVMKIKNSLVPWLVLLGGFIVGVFFFLDYNFGVVWQVHFDENPWDRLYGLSTGLFCTFIATPLLVLIIASLVQIEHRALSWKNLYALPLAKGDFHFSKLLMCFILFFLSILLYILAIYIDAKILHVIHPEYEFNFHAPDS